MYPDRYKRNFPAISEAEQEILKSKTVSVIGCGGLGGNIIDSLARVGVGCIRVIDCDEFSESNLNRQLLSSEKNLGKRKAKEAAKRIKLINSEVKVKVVDKMLCKENAVKILKGSDIVVDAMDNIEGRFIAADACAELGIYFIHGAISGWCAQASTVAPGSDFLSKIYPRDVKLSPPSVLSFAPGFAAGVQVSETLKVLLGYEDTLENKLFIADLKNDTFNVIDF